MIMIKPSAGLAPSVIGHRGAAGHAPENTLAAVRRAAELGVTWVEFDTKLTADGQVVVFHDDDLDRTTDGHGQISRNTLASLENLDAGDWYGPAFAGQRVPTLREMFDVLAEHKLGANIEIKPSPGRETESGHAVASLVRRHWPKALAPPVISSFKPQSLEAARSDAPEIERALLFLRMPGDWHEQAEGLDCSALHCLHRYMTRPRVEAIKAAGYALRCFTVNNRRTARKLFRWGVDTVISDYPDRMLSL
jgi:glycerophosphoryl diester phosphodiesterase